MKPNDVSRRALLAVAALFAGCRADAPTREGLDTRSAALAPPSPAQVAEPSAAPPQVPAPGVRPSEPSGANTAAPRAAGTDRRKEPRGSAHVSPAPRLRAVGVAPGDVLNLREEPDAGSRIVGTIPPNGVDVEDLGAGGESSSWRRVRYGSRVGWVKARFLAAAEGSGAGAARAAATAPPRAGDAPARLKQALVCFGNEPYWRVELNPDGSASCHETCAGPAGLRIAALKQDPSGEPLELSIVTAEGGVFMSAQLKRTGQCSDGMSDDPHPYEFSATGKAGALNGCCRNKTPR